MAEVLVLTLHDLSYFRSVSALDSDTATSIRNRVVLHALCQRFFAVRPQCDAQFRLVLEGT